MTDERPSGICPARSPWVEAHIIPPGSLTCTACGTVVQRDVKPSEERPPLKSSNDVCAADSMEGPHAWIQWKGTNACMDLHCACGHHGHVDAEFAYHYECPACHEVWALGSHVRLYRLAPEEQARIREKEECLTQDIDRFATLPHQGPHEALTDDEKRARWDRMMGR